jgi:hypothetical protein
MKIGKVVRVIKNVPAPIIVKPGKEPDPIAVPNWPQPKKIEVNK